LAEYDSPYDPATAPKDLEHVIYEKKGHVAYVTLNRPEVRNALHTWAYVELRSCWKDIARDPNIYVAILTGNGPSFCAGRDVKFLAEYQAQGKRTPHEDPNSPLYHWGGGGHLVIAPVRICRGATIGLAATIMGNVEVGAGAVILPHSVVLPGSRVGAGETWGGVPARPIGNDERERFKRLVQGIEEGEELQDQGPTR